MLDQRKLIFLIGCFVLMFYIFTPFIKIIIDKNIMLISLSYLAALITTQYSIEGAHSAIRLAEFICIYMSIMIFVKNKSINSRIITITLLCIIILIIARYIVDGVSGVILFVEHFGILVFIVLLLRTFVSRKINSA